MAGAADMSEESKSLSTAAYLLCAAVFIVLMLYSLFRSMEPLSKIQMAPLRTRLYWCIKANVYICFMSAVLNVLHVTNFEYLISAALGPHALVIKPLEYLLTCPVMMLTLTVLGGEEVPPRRQLENMGLTAVVLLCGFLASFSGDVLPMKLMFFVTGCLFFCCLLQRLSVTVREHSQGEEALFWGGYKGSVYKHLCLKIVSTWVLFPAWWLFSNEGLGVVKNQDVNILVTVALNIFAKGVYVMYLQMIHDRYIGASSLMEHPHKKPAAERDAQYAAGRLGPAGAIAALEKSIASETKSISIIKEQMMREVGSHQQEPPDNATSASSSTTANSNDQWETLSALVTQVCCESGEGEFAGQLLSEFHHQHVRSVTTLEQLRQHDMEALRVPIGLRHSLQAAARRHGARKPSKKGSAAAPSLDRRVPDVPGTMTSEGTDCGWGQESDGSGSECHTGFYDRPVGSKRITAEGALPLQGVLPEIARGSACATECSTSSGTHGARKKTATGHAQWPLQAATPPGDQQLSGAGPSGVMPGRPEAVPAGQVAPLRDLPVLMPPQAALAERGPELA